MATVGTGTISPLTGQVTLASNASTGGVTPAINWSFQVTQPVYGIPLSSGVNQVGSTVNLSLLSIQAGFGINLTVTNNNVITIATNALLIGPTGFTGPTGPT